MWQMPLEQLLPAEFAKLGVMGWPLLVSSMLTLLFILERLSFFLFVDFGGKRLQHRLGELLNTHRDDAKLLRDEILSLELSRGARRFNRGIGALRLLAAVSPLLGLLGTILGIIAAFQVIAATEGPVTPNLIADGLWEALLTTAFGLMIALPAVVAAGFFQTWKQSILETIQANLNEKSIQIALTSDNLDQTIQSQNSNGKRLAS